MAKSYSPYVHKYSQQFGVDPSLVHALIRAESGGNPNARSPAGAGGLGQLMPGTARGLGVKDVFDPEQNIMGTAKYLSQQLKAFGGDTNKALAAYNAGPGAVRKYGGIPPYKETQAYVKRINGYLKEQGGLGKMTEPSSRPGSVGLNKAPANIDFYSIFKDRPDVAAVLTKRRMAQAQPTMQPAPNKYAGISVDAAPAKGKPTGKSWKDLQRIAQERFGLSNDPGDSQTTGGKHTAGSEHYSGRAIDFGDARNSKKQLLAWLKWARANGYDAIDEGDHIHVSLPGGGI